MNYSPYCICARHCYSYILECHFLSLGWFSLICMPFIILLNACVESSKINGFLCWCFFLLFGPLSYEHYLPLLPWGLSSISPTQEIHQYLLRFLLLVPQTDNSPKAVSWGIHRAHFVCFPCLMDSLSLSFSDKVYRKPLFQLLCPFFYCHLGKK